METEDFYLFNTYTEEDLQDTSLFQRLGRLLRIAEAEAMENTNRNTLVDHAALNVSKMKSIITDLKHYLTHGANPFTITELREFRLKHPDVFAGVVLSVQDTRLFLTEHIELSYRAWVERVPTQYELLGFSNDYTFMVDPTQKPMMDSLSEALLVSLDRDLEANNTLPSLRRYLHTLGKYPNELMGLLLQVIEGGVVKLMDLGQYIGVRLDSVVEESYEVENTPSLDYELVEGLDDVGKTTFITAKYGDASRRVLVGTRGVCELGKWWRDYITKPGMDLPNVAQRTILDSIQKNMFLLNEDKYVWDRGWVSAAAYQSVTVEDAISYVKDLMSRNYFVAPKVIYYLSSNLKLVSDRVDVYEAAADYEKFRVRRNMLAVIDYLEKHTTINVVRINNNGTLDEFINLARQLREES